MYINLSIISITILLLLLLLQKLRSKTSKKKPPSPPSLPIIGHLHLLNNPLHQTLARLSDRYGPMLSLQFGARPVLVVSSASTAEECFTKNDIIFANRVQLPSLKHLSYNFNDLAMSNYGPHWRNSRRIVTVEVLSSRRLSLFADVRELEVNAMIRRLLGESNPNGSLNKVELKSRLFELSLNNLMTIIFGRRPEDSEEMKKFQESVEEVLKIGGASNISDFLPFLGWMDFEGIVKKSKTLARYRDDLLQKMLDEHREAKEDELEYKEEDKTMVGKLISLQKVDPEHHSDEVIKCLVLDLISGGTETTSGAIEWAMALLLNNPDKLKKAQTEIDKHLKHERLLQESDLSNLPYLECVIKETHRLYPGGPLLIPHESSEECMVAGYQIAKGTMLLVNVYAIQRDENTWADANEFIPERFFEAVEEKIFTFGMGRRKCPGEALANKVVGLALGRMLQCFDWERVGDELVDMTEGSGLTLPRVSRLEAMYRPRETMINVLLDI